MKKFLAFFAGVIFSLHGMVTSAEAAVIDAPVDSSEYITIDGVDWAWAGPCAPYEPSCGVIDMSYQGPLGWAVATASQITAAITAAGGLTAWVDQFALGDICASAYFNVTYSHCDYSDGYRGYIFDYLGNPDSGMFDEVFVLRGTPLPPVPVPASLPLLIGGILSLAFFARANRRA